jgi:small GTP-binding protein
MNAEPSRNGELEDVRAALERLDLPAWMRPLVSPSIKRSLDVLAKDLEPPRVAFYGRTGAGKSSLINALLGRHEAATGEASAVTMDANAYEFNRDGWKLEIVDSRGVGDHGGDKAYYEAIAQVVNRPPDVIVFVVPALERAYVDEDVQFLKALTGAHRRQHKSELPVILAVTKIDLVGPAEEWSPPYDLNISGLTRIPDDDSSVLPSLRARKESGIRAILRDRLEAYREVLFIGKEVGQARVIPVCADWNDLRDRSYNVSNLAEAMLECLPESARESFAGAVAIQGVKAKASQDLITRISLAAGGCALSPAGLDAFLVGCLIFAMVSVIARIGQGQEIDNKTPVAFLKRLGVFGPGPLVAMFIPLLKLFGVGFIMAAVAAPTVAVIVYAIGQAAVHHFIEGSSLESARAVFENQKSEPGLRERLGKMLKRDSSRSA